MEDYSTIHTKAVVKVEKAWSPSSVCVRTVVPALVVADRRQLLLELVLTKCTRSQRYVGQS